MDADKKISERLADRQSVPSLLGQLADDTKAFARAEMDYLKAEAGERVDYALPGAVMIGISIALGLGAIVAFLVGLIFVLSPLIGVPLAVVLMCMISAGISILLWNFGATRLRGAFKRRDQR